MTTRKIRPKERDAIIQSLRSGVTPKVGIQHVQVGRSKEIQALHRDLERVADGGSAFRLIIGDYGSGKTFFLSVIRSIAMEMKMVTMNADLSPDRRIHATSGQARNLFSELVRNMATRNKPEGNALVNIVERFITEAVKEADSQQVSANEIIHKRLSDLSQLVGGYDFAKVVEQYWIGHESSDENLKSNAIRWLRAEYTTKTQARSDLGVRNIIGDADFYDGLKLMSLFVRQAGYSGLLVNLDEMVNLYKLSSTQARVSNYEQILRILNDCLQGSAEGIGFLLGGTPEFLIDPRKGLYSYEALQSRLAGNAFAQKAGVIDYNSPALHLSVLTQEELYILLKNLRNVYALGVPEKYLVPDEALISFLKHCFTKIGESYFRTPRSIIKAFLDMLSVLEQSPEIKWDTLVESVQLEEDRPTDMDIEINDEEGGTTASGLSTSDDAEDELGSFKI